MIEQYSDMLRDVQLLQLGALKKLDEICTKHGIQYFALFGTLLGAIRHKGFIPWDDDLDLGMTREDFVKLKKVPQEEWGDEYLFCAADTDLEIHDKFFGRVYIARSRVQSEKDVRNWHNWSNNEPWSTSLMCDIYILDHIPADHEAFMKIKNKCDKLMALYSITRHKPYCLNGTPMKRMKRAVRSAQGRALRAIWKKPWKHYDALAQRIIESGYDGGEMLGCYRSAGWGGEWTYSHHDFFPLQKTLFEDIMIPIPKEWKRMLEDSYDDYMTPPPPEERAHLKPSFLDLGDGVEHIFSEPLPNSLGDHKRNK